MKASEALTKSKANATLIAKQKEITNKKKAISVAKCKITKRQEFLKDFEEDCRIRIESAVEDGRFRTEMTLSENNQDLRAGEYKYGKNLYQDYLKNAWYGKEIKKVMAKLRREGYKVEIVGEWVEHDSTAAYMNSGGECGSMENYYTNDSILVISWAKEKK